MTKEIRENGLDDLKYDVMCGQWPMDEEVLDSMKSAGYYMIRLGIETAGEHAAKGMELQKKFNVPRLKQLMEHGTNIGLKFYGTFTFGGEGSTDDCDKKLWISFANYWTGNCYGGFNYPLAPLSQELLFLIA